MPQPYLICYDITKPKRLRLMHRRLKRFGIPIQYSIFHATLTDARLREVIAMIKSVIDPKTDDVRIYPLPQDGWARSVGRSVLPAGLTCTALPAIFSRAGAVQNELVLDNDQLLVRSIVDGGQQCSRAERLRARKHMLRQATGQKLGITLLP